MKFTPATPQEVKIFVLIRVRKWDHVCDHVNVIVCLKKKAVVLVLKRGPIRKRAIFQILSACEWICV